MGSLSQIEVEGQEFVDYQVVGVGGVMVYVASGETFFYDAFGNVGISQDARRRIIKEINELSDEREVMLTTQESLSNDISVLIASQSPTERLERSYEESFVAQAASAIGRDGERIPGEFGYHKVDTPLQVRGGRNEGRRQERLISIWQAKISSAKLNL